jgi:hypothetical protein
VAFVWLFRFGCSNRMGCEILSSFFVILVCVMLAV